MTTIAINIHRDDMKRIQAAVAAGLLSLDQLVGAFGGEIEEDCWVSGPGWWCQDADGGAEYYPDALTAQDAAEEYVASGDWTGSSAHIHDVRCWKDGIDRDGDAVDVCEEDVDVIINSEQDEPECVDADTAHKWIGERVTSNGGGVISSVRCKHCGIIRHTNTWAQDSSSGRVMPGDVVTYEEPEEDN